MIGEQVRRLVGEPLFWLLATLLLYLGLIVFTPADFAHSGGGNFSLAVSYAQLLLSTGSFDGAVHIAPGQPVVLAMAMSILPLSFQTMRIIQLILFAIIIAETFSMAKLLFSRKAAIIASIIASLWLPLILQLFSQSTDLLFSALAMGSLYFFLKAERSRQVGYAVVAGLTATLAALTDPIGLYFPLVFILPLLSIAARQRFFGASQGNAKDLLVILIFVSVFTLSLAPWYYRNITVFGGVENAPLIQKGWETAFFTDSNLRWYILHTFAPNNLDDVASGLGQFFFIPFGLDSLDQNTELSYKSALLGILTGEREIAPFSSREKLVLAVKALVTLLHWSLLALALIGLWASRRSHIAYVYIGLTLYLIVATFSYGVLDAFNNISPLNGFFFLILPLTAILGAQGFLSIRNFYWKVIHT